MKSGRPFNVLDLFSGIGGFSLGLERTGGFNTVAFCEIDQVARMVLKKHWPHVPIYEDIRELTAAKLQADGIAVDVITGGFPCQDISQAGLRAGIIGERSGLWTEYYRLIKELHPKYVVIENVSALRSRGLTLVLQNLSEIGYDAEWHCIPASSVGASHERDRIWIVADRSSRRQEEQGKGQDQLKGGTTIECSGTPMAYPINTGPQGWLSGWPDAERESLYGCLGRSLSSVPDRWVALPGQPAFAYEPPRTTATKPRLGRASNGLPTRMDRIKQLGNAVVPQIPELLGRAILEREGGEEA